MKARARLLIAALAAVSIAWGCTSSDSPADAGASSCPSDLPSACPSPPPSYAKDVAPIFARRCVVCHSEGGVEAERDYTTYDRIHQLRTDILTQVYACRMPPADAAAPTLAERETLLGWLVCGAPNN